MVDEETSEPIDSVDSIRILEEQNAAEQLASDGLDVASIAAVMSGPRPVDNEDEQGKC